MAAHVKLSSTDFWLLPVCLGPRGGVSQRPLHVWPRCFVIISYVFRNCLLQSRTVPAVQRGEARSHTWPGRPRYAPAVNMCEPLNTKMRVDVNRHTQTQSGPFPLDLRGPRRYNCSGYIWRWVEWGEGFLGVGCPPLDARPRAIEGGTPELFSIRWRHCGGFCWGVEMGEPGQRRPSC